MDHLPNWVFYAIGIVIGVPLLVIADRIRRRTGGRIRHVGIHLLAWLPLPILLGAMYLRFPFPIKSGLLIAWVACATIVYLMFFGARIVYGRAWNRGEDALEQQDASIQKEHERRARIESYKHGQRERPQG